jgi:hypothetical protein
VSLAATLFADQRGGERQALEADATLRHEDRVPHDVTIDEISSTGCHVATLLDFPAGTVASLGIPRIGMHQVRLVRETGGGYGCAFLRPLTASELATALASEAAARVTFADFAQQPAVRADQRLTPPGLLGAAIVAAIALSWAAVGLALRAAGIL